MLSDEREATLMANMPDSPAPTDAAKVEAQREKWGAGIGILGMVVGAAPSVYIGYPLLGMAHRLASMPSPPPSPSREPPSKSSAP